MLAGMLLVGRQVGRLVVVGWYCGQVMMKDGFKIGDP
jgi:hypothetical protein